MFCAVLCGEVVISSITLAELECGVTCSGDAQSGNRAALSSLLVDLAVALFDAAAATACVPSGPWCMF